MQDYIAARDNYDPRKVGIDIKILLIGESPPEGGSYFYFEKATGRGNLFRETMKALDIPCGKLSNGADKTKQLSEFQKRGFFLVDLSYIPINKLSYREKNKILAGQIPRLLEDIKALQPLNIIILKSNLYNPVRKALELARLGDRILNERPIPFPSNGWQAKYQQKIKEIIS